MDDAHARTIVKAFSILSFIGAAFCIALMGISYLAAGVSADPSGQAGATIMGFIVFLAVAVIYEVALGIGLSRVRNWARRMLLAATWLCLAFSLLVALGNGAEGMYTTASFGVVGVVLCSVTLWLFQFNDAVRAQFGIVATETAPPSATSNTTQPAEAMMLAPEVASSVQRTMDSTVPSVRPRAKPRAVAKKTSKPVAKKNPAKKKK